MLVLDLSDDLAAHVAVALRRHRQWLPTQGLRAPAGLADLELAFHQAATDRQGPTTVAACSADDDFGVVAPKLLRFADCATSLSVSKRTVERLVASGDLTSVEIGGVPRVRAADLAAYVAGLQTRVAAGEPGVTTAGAVVERSTTTAPAPHTREGAA